MSDTCVLIFYFLLFHLYDDSRRACVRPMIKLISLHCVVFYLIFPSYLLSYIIILFHFSLLLFLHSGCAPLLLSVISLKRLRVLWRLAVTHQYIITLAAALRPVVKISSTQNTHYGARVTVVMKNKHLILILSPCPSLPPLPLLTFLSEG